MLFRSPEVIDSFRELAETGCVEFLTETNSHSLASLKSKEEFEKQVKIHQSKIKALFGYEPTAIRNTEMIYSDTIGSWMADMGFKVTLTEGAKHVLGWKSPNYVYCNTINPRLKVLLRNFVLSDDIAFRFANRQWSEWPLTAPKYAGWINQASASGEVVNLFVEYETFGELQGKETGIMDFLSHLPSAIIKSTPCTFMTPTEVGDNFQPVAAVPVPSAISWADEERDLTAWLGNELQTAAFTKLYDLAEKIYSCAGDELKKDWEYLQSSDHFHYMSTKFFSDGAVNSYYNPYETPYDAFMNYMNILSDFEIRINQEVPCIEESVLTRRLSEMSKDKDALIAKLQKEIDILNRKPSVARTAKAAAGGKVTPKVSAKSTGKAAKAGAVGKVTPKATAKSAGKAKVTGKTSRAVKGREGKMSK